MQDSPDAPAILAELQTALRAGLVPGFTQVVAANAIGLALREQAQASAGHAAEQARLTALLGRDGDLADLNRALTEGIRSGALTADNPALTRHLILTTVEKISVDQPGYPAFRAWCRAIGRTP